MLPLTSDGNVKKKCYKWHSLLTLLYTSLQITKYSLVCGLQCRLLTVPWCIMWTFYSSFPKAPLFTISLAPCHHPGCCRNILVLGFLYLVSRSGIAGHTVYTPGFAPAVPVCSPQHSGLPGSCLRVRHCLFFLLTPNTCGSCLQVLGQSAGDKVRSSCLNF